VLDEAAEAVAGADVVYTSARPAEVWQQAANRLPSCVAAITRMVSRSAIDGVNDTEEVPR
jgi:hypothetical protein